MIPLTETEVDNLSLARTPLHLVKPTYGDNNQQYTHPMNECTMFYMERQTCQLFLYSVYIPGRDATPTQGDRAGILNLATVPAIARLLFTKATVESLTSTN